MNDTIKMFGDTYTEFNVMFVNYRELNMNLINTSEQKRLYDLFSYLVNKGYDNAAIDLWDNMIKKNFIVKPL